MIVACSRRFSYFARHVSPKILLTKPFKSFLFLSLDMLCMTFAALYVHGVGATPVLLLFYRPFFNTTCELICFISGLPGYIALNPFLPPKSWLNFPCPPYQDQVVAIFPPPKISFFTHHFSFSFFPCTNLRHNPRRIPPLSLRIP